MARGPAGALIRAEGLDLDDPDQRRRVTRRLAYKVLGGIAEAGEVDASGLVAGVLLASEERFLSREEITSRCRNLQRQRPPPFGSVKSSKTTSSSPSEIPSICAQRVDPAFRLACGVPPHLRGKLVYMRNQSLHPFVCGALLLRSVEREADEQGVAPKDAVHDRLSSTKPASA